MASSSDFKYYDWSLSTGLTAILPVVVSDNSDPKIMKILILLVLLQVKWILLKACILQKNTFKDIEIKTRNTLHYLH